jgi:hypothetical protein
MTPTPAASDASGAAGASVPPVPGGGNREPRDVDGVAGLAREVDTLRRALDHLRDHLRDHLSDLPERVDELTKLATDLTNAVAALTARRAAPPCPSWLLLPADPDLARQVLDELVGWLAMVYLRYPDGADHLPECWAWHPDVVEELLWLMHAWAGAYQGPQAGVALVGDWHDRQRPGAVRRIKTAAGSCSFENHQTRPGWTHLTGAAPTVPGMDAIASIAGWWALRRDQAAPEPAPRLSRVAGPNHAGGRR